MGLTTDVANLLKEQQTGRRVRITLEGHVEIENDAAIYVVSDNHVTNRIRKADATIEELTVPYDWRDGDVVQMESRHGATFTVTRNAGADPVEPWRNQVGGKWSDDAVSNLVDGGLADSYPTVRILRYQAGGIGS